MKKNRVSGFIRCAFFLMGVAFVGVGCRSMWVKLAVRDFSRAAGKGDKKGLMERSTAELNQKVWVNISREEFADMVKLLKRLRSKKDLSSMVSVLDRSDNSQAGENTSLKKKGGKKAKISVEVKKDRARLHYKKGFVRARFDLIKKERDWKVDDIVFDLGPGQAPLSLRRDLSLYESGYGFLRGAKNGSRHELMAHCSVELRRELGKLSPSMYSYVTKKISKTAVKSEEEIEKSRESSGDKPRFMFKISQNRARIQRTKGDKLYGVIMVREDKGWKVDDLLFSYLSLSGKRKVASLKNLVRVSAALRRFVKDLAGKEFGRVIGSPKIKKGRKGGTKNTLNKPLALPRLQSPKLLGFDLNPDKATVMLGSGDKQLKVDLLLENNLWRVDDVTLNIGKKSITLGEALAFKDVFFAIVKAGFKGDVEALKRQSTEELTQNVWARLGSVSALKKRLLGGGLNDFLGVNVLPESAFDKVGFIAKVGSRLSRVRKGKVKFKGAWTKENRGVIVIELFQHRVELFLKKAGGRWLLDDVKWHLDSGVRSLKKSALFLVEKKMSK